MIPVAPYELTQLVGATLCYFPSVCTEGVKDDWPPGVSGKVNLWVKHGYPQLHRQWVAYHSAWSTLFYVSDLRPSVSEGVGSPRYHIGSPKPAPWQPGGAEQLPDRQAVRRHRHAADEESNGPADKGQRDEADNGQRTRARTGARGDEARPATHQGEHTQ
jgi:hypothetical protein